MEISPESIIKLQEIGTKLKESEETLKKSEERLKKYTNDLEKITEKSDKLNNNLNEIENKFNNYSNSLDEFSNSINNLKSKIEKSFACEKCGEIDLLHDCYFCGDKLCHCCYTTTERKNYRGDTIIIYRCKYCNSD